jgi:hypothetical protein
MSYAASGSSQVSPGMAQVTTAQPPTSILEITIRSCYRHQERIAEATMRLRAMADGVLGQLPDAPSTGSGAKNPNTGAKVQELGIAQNGIDEALDRLMQQIDRFHAL